MKLEQINKLSLSTALFFIVIIISNLILKIPFIAHLFSSEILLSSSGIWIWVLTWLLLFLECGIIPGPYLPIIIFCTSTAMVNNILVFTLFATSAVACGRVLAYFIGANTAGKLIKWSAGNEIEYNNWCSKLRGKSGIITYALTVALPGFPDFILALIAGSIKMNFWIYLIINTICKGIENYLLAGFGIISQGFDKFGIVYISIILISIFIYIITKVKLNKNK